MANTTVAAGSSGVQINTWNGTQTLNVAANGLTGFLIPNSATGVNLATGTFWVQTQNGLKAVTYTVASMGASPVFGNVNANGQTGYLMPGTNSGFISQSNDQGTLYSIRPGVPLRTPFFITGQPTASAGTYAGLENTLTPSGLPISNVIFSTRGYDYQTIQGSTTTPLLKTNNTVTTGSGTTTTYYKMRGWYATGSTYEVWVVVGAPSSTPPSGHTLTNVTVVAQWSI